MISVVCSSINPDPKFKEYFIKKMSLPKDKVEFIHYKNDNEYSLTEIYNKGLQESKYDIVIFTHDDIIIDSTNIGNKILKHFNNSDYAILGVAGTKHLKDSGIWWEDKNSLYGVVNHQKDNKSWTTKFSEDIGNNIEQVCCVDGVFFSVNKKRLKNNFDENIKGFHFYDIDFSFSNHLNGAKVGVHTNIKITHKSVGEVNDMWYKNKEQFLNKHSNNIPSRVYENFDNRKIKVMFITLIEDMNDSKIDLLKGLKELKCDITLVSDFNKSDLYKFNKYILNNFNIKEPPGFKLIGGKLQRFKSINYDIVYVNSERLNKIYENIYPEFTFIDTDSKEYYICEKTPNGYKKLFLNTYNNE